MLRFDLILIKYLWKLIGFTYKFKKMETGSTIFENIWLADDDKDDRDIFEDAVKQILPNVSITTISGGGELMGLLSAGKVPDILFLDINMPCKNGFDCLKEIRNARQFLKLPIVIFSSSHNHKDIDTSYGYGANLFYSKPSSFSDLIAGLSNLLVMDWSDPYTITSNHYVNHKFIAFKSH